MLVKSEILSRIKDQFGLNTYEAKIWIALLSKGVASAGEVAEISNVPRSRAYDVLEGLEKRGFAIVKLGKPVKYLGVKPKMVLEKLKNNVKKNAEEKIEVLAKIDSTEEFSQLEQLYTNGITPSDRESLSASIKGKSNISNQVREILEEAKKEVIVCMDVEDLTRKFKLFQETFDRLKKNNVKVLLALFGDKEKIKEISGKLDIKIKQVSINARFFIVDRKEILFNVSKDSQGEEIAIWLNSDFFVEAFSSLFDLALDA